MISKTWTYEKRLKIISTRYEIEIRTIINERIILKEEIKEQLNTLKSQQQMTIQVRSISKNVILKRD